MFKYSIISLEELNFISNRIHDLDLSMFCNVELLNRLRLDLPYCRPFGAAQCLGSNSEYRLWCSLRSSVLSQIKDRLNG